MDSSTEGEAMTEEKKPTLRTAAQVVADRKSATEVNQGMVKDWEEKKFRDGCAVSAMQGLVVMLGDWIGDPETPEETFAEWVSWNAFDMADAMVAEQRRRDEA